MPLPTLPSALGRFAIRADGLIDGTGAPARGPSLVVVRDGIIEAVEDARRAGVPGCPVVERPGTTLLPGLIDAHTHLWFQVPEEAIDPGAALLLAMRSAGLALSGGTTTARDLGGPGDVLPRLQGAIAAGVVPGPRLLVAGPPITTPRGHCHWFGRHATTTAEIRGAVREVAAMGADVVKLMVTGGMSTPGTDPYAPQHPADVARAAVEEAHALGLPVAAHALGTPGVRRAIEIGVDTLEHGWTITGREQRYEPDVVPVLARTSIVASVTAHHALRELLPWDPEGRADLAELRRRLIPHRAVAAAGVPMVVHSDTGPDTTRHEGFGESLAVFALGMERDAVATVHAATGVPARALGIADRVGAVRPGVLADLVVLDGDPAEDLAAFARVADVWQGGRHVAHRGALLATPLPTPWETAPGT